MARCKKSEETNTMIKAHNDILNSKECETYLGDVITKTGSNNKNIEHRKNNGLAAISQIISILNLTSLGHFYFEIALILRESILLSKLVFNSEVWYNVSSRQLETLEQIDELFMRKILNTPKTTPKVALYIECGKMPVRFIVKMRRLMYYWHILTRNKDELIFKFYSAQKYSPSKGDWFHQVRKDLVDLQIELNEEEISKMSNYQFKKLVRHKIEKIAILDLESQRKKKSIKLSIEKFEPQKYVLSKNLTISEVQNLFKLRFYMIDVKENFKSSYRDNMLCMLCLLQSESQQHLLDCHIIRDKLKGVVRFENLNLEMMYQPIESQEIIAKSYTIILNTRRDLLSLQTGNQ